MTPLATVADLEKRLGVPVGSLEGEDLTRAQEALEDVSSLIRAEADQDFLDEDGNVVAPPAVLTVARQAAKRAYLNPEDLNSENTSDYGSSRQSVGVYLTSDERRIIARAIATRPGAKWSGTGSIGIRSAYGSYAPTTDPTLGGLL